MHVVVGSGIAGCEAALTIAAGCPDTRVTMVGPWPSLRVLPNLVYVPLCMSPQRVDVPLEEPLNRRGISLVRATCERVDLDGHTVTCNGSELEWDRLVLAPGTMPVPVSGHRLRNLDDALVLRDALGGLDASQRADITVRILPEAAWAAPAYEFALLLSAWTRSMGRHRWTVSIVTPEHEPLNVFGVETVDVISAQLEHHGVQLVSGVPAGRVEDIEGTVNFDIGALRARHIAGTPVLSGPGYYDVAPDGSIAPDVYVVGDAASLPYKAAFATSWQARRIVTALGGDIANLGSEVDGLPVNLCEYDMDMGDRTLSVRFDAAAHFKHPFIDTRVDVRVLDAPADKLVGTMIKQELLAGVDSARFSGRFRSMLAEVAAR